MYKNKILMICPAIFVIWLIIGGIAYGSAPVIISAETGFDGKCKAGGINPVRVTMESTERDVSGALTVAVGEKMYRHQVDLPAGTTKTIPFSVLVLNKDREAILSFKDDNGGVVARHSAPLEIAPENSFLVGLLGDTPEELFYIREMRSPLLAGKDVLTVNLDRNLPFTPAEMQNINLIIVDNFNTGGLAAGKEAILQRWLAGGGGLALGGPGRDGYKNLTGMFAGLEGARPTGNGCAAALPFSPAAGDDPSGVAKAVEQYITASGLARLINGTGLSGQAAAAGELQRVGDRLFQPSYNEVFFLLVLAAVYILLLGACVFWRERPRWAVPAVVAGFAALFYLLAWSGGLHRIKAVSAGVEIHGYNHHRYYLTNLYPHQRQLQVRLPGACFVKELGGGNFSIDPSEDAITYYDAAPHYLYSRETAPGGNHPPELGLNGDLLTGEINNPLAIDLVNCSLLVGDSVIGLGDLDGLGGVRLEYRLEHGLRNLGDYNFLDAVSRAANLDSYQRELLKYYHYQAGEQGPQGKMLGFGRGQRELVINGKLRKIATHTLHVFPVSIQTGPGPATLPPGLIRPVVDCGKPAGGVKNEYTLQAGEKLVAYYVLPPDARVGEITLHARVEGGEANLEVYNRRQDAWEPLAPGLLRGAALGRYAGDGPLAVAITGSGRVIIPQIELKL